MFGKKNSESKVTVSADTSPVMVETVLPQKKEARLTGRGLVIIRNEDNNGWRIDLVHADAKVGQVTETLYRTTVWPDLVDRFKILSFQTLLSDPGQYKV